MHFQKLKTDKYPKREPSSSGRTHGIIRRYMLESDVGVPSVACAYVFHFIGTRNTTIMECGVVGEMVGM